MNLNSNKFLFVLITFIFLCSCNQEKNTSKKPNILFAISDDQSFKHTSFNGCNFVKTPAFDKIASEGIYFSNCYAGSPGCAPSRSSIVTGRYHWQNEQSGQHASSWMKKHVPFVDLLNENGYVTGLTGKGVGPFQYARNESDSLWRKTNAAGIKHSNIAYENSEPKEFGGSINQTNYFENFKYFMENVKGEKPFFFWYGGHEPHRAYEKGSWKRHGKNLNDIAHVPEFLPDNEEIRGDLLDYAVEIEWFDSHLEKMLNYLDSIGELENTIVIVTADNGMPFPRAKANCFEYGVHVPFAVRYPKKFPGNRIVENPISFIDLAPTILEISETPSDGMLPITGESILQILKSEKQGIIDKNNSYVLAGRERHSCSRHNNAGYPQRMIRSKEFILTWNAKPERWPAGAPQRYNPNDSSELWPMFGLDDNGKYIKDAAFMDIDDCPSKTYLIENHDDLEISKYFEYSVGIRPEYELYNVVKDPSCLQNLADDAEHASILEELKSKLIKELERTNDPRISDNEIFDSYKRYSRMRAFPKPE